MKKVNELILILLVLQLLFIGTSWSLREMTNCHGNFVLHYTSDKPMELCCQVDSPLCVQEPSLLTLTKAGGPRGTELDVGGNVTESRDAVSIKLVIPSPKEDEDSGMYYCNCNGSRLKSGRVAVFIAIGPPTVHSITSTMDEVVTVKFNPGEPIPNFSGVYYTVKAHTDQGKVVVMCEKINRTSCQRLCTCQGKINKEDRYPLVRRGNVTFVVSRHVSYHHSATTVNVNLLQNVIPNPVRAIQVEDVSHTSATLAMCAIDMDAYVSVVTDMVTKNPLQMILSVIKTQGSYEKRKYTITFNKPDFKYCVRVPLSQLIPFTKYDVKVTMSGGGGPSTPVYKSFTTHEAAPLSPPEGILYWMVPETPTSGSSNSYAINLNWPPIPHDKKGGPISYTVSYSYDDQKKAYDSDVPRFTLRDIPDTPVTVDIYAKNKNGTSTSSSRVIIQKDSAQAAIELLQSHVEIAGDEADIYLQRPPPKIPVTNIYWCPGTQNPQLPLEVVCKEFPKMVLRGTSLKNEKDMSHASVTLTKEKCQREIVSEPIQETYNVYGDSKKSSDERRNVTVVREFANEDGTCASPSQSDVFKDSNQQLKFMFAVKDRPQLFPFRCYYNKNKTDVRLSFHQPVGKKLLEWRQNCDYNSPQQFFARKYSVYSSQDDNCIYSNQTLIEMENKIIPRSAIEISQTDGFVCVRASNLRLGVTRSYKLLSYGEGDQAAGTPPLVTVVIICIIILVIAVIAVVCVYRKRAEKAKMDMGRFSKTQFVNHTYVFVESETCKHTKHTDDSGLPSSSDYENVERDKNVPSDDDQAGKGSDGNVSNLMFGDSVGDRGNDKGSKVLDGSSSLGTKHKPDSGMSSGLENSSGGSEMDANSGSNCSSGDSVMEANSGSHYSSGDSEIEADRHCSSGDSEMETSGGSHQSEALVSQSHCSGESEASIRLKLQSMIDRQKRQQMDQDSDSSDNGG